MSAAPPMSVFWKEVEDSAPRHRNEFETSVVNDYLTKIRVVGSSFKPGGQMGKTKLQTKHFTAFALHFPQTGWAIPTQPTR